MNRRFDTVAAKRPRPRLHVLLVIDGLGWGGAEMLLPELIRAADSVDVDVSVAYLREKHGNPAANRLREIGVEPVGLSVGGLVRAASLRSVYRHIDAVRPDVVHTHLGYSDTLGGLAAGLHGLPTISTIHVTRWDGSARERVKLRLFDLARRCTASAVIAVSDAARTEYLRRGWGPRKRVLTVHNCISGKAAPGAGKRVRAELGIGANEVVVGMVSVLRQGKGHRVAGQAMARVLARLPTARFLVVGDGPARAEVEASLAPLGGAALFTGHRDDVMSVLDAVDILLQPSEHEAFPTSILEAMAAGVPVVAADVGGIGEMVTDGITGRLLPAPVTMEAIAEALVQLLESPADRSTMGKRARRRLESEFSLERWGESLRSLYEAAQDESPRPVQRLAGSLRVARIRRL